MKKKLILFLLLALGLTLNGQDRYFTKTGHIDFFSSTPVEDIKASNDQVTSFIDIKTGEMVFSVLMRSFAFEKALMQEHFNENYVESDKFPKAGFEGRIFNADKITWDKPGTVPVKVKGKLTIHGVTKEIETDGTLIIESGKITGKSSFKVKPEDYGIVIPQVVRKNFAEQMAINVQMNYQPYKK
jgi:polyisoprenoid-binding protein YceI